MSGDDVLNGWIDGLRGLGRDGLSEIAKEAAPGVQEAARATAAAGKSPAGAAWAKTKKDGKRAMVAAAEHVTATASGPTIRIKLTGPDVFHQFRVRGEPERMVIPDATSEIPPAAAAAIREAAARVLERRLGGGR